MSNFTCQLPGCQLKLVNFQDVEEKLRRGEDRLAKSRTQVPEMWFRILHPEIGSSSASLRSSLALSDTKG